MRTTSATLAWFLSGCIGAPPSFDAMTTPSDAPDTVETIDPTDSDDGDEGDEGDVADLDEGTEVDEVREIVGEVDTTPSCIGAGALEALAGAWFVVLSNATDAADATVRMDLALGADGRAGVSNVASNDPTWAAAFRSGTYCTCADAADCTDAAGRVTLGLGIDLVAVPDATRALMVLSGDADRAVGIALRAGGQPADVHGRYQLVKTDQHTWRNDSLMTRVGHLTFERGCITGQGALTTTPALGPALDLVATDTCLTQADDRRMRLTVGVRVAGTTTTFDETWVGAISGDVLVFVREEPGLVYPGVIVLTRESTTTAALAGDWAFVQHRAGSADPNVAPTVVYETGRVTLGADFSLLSNEGARDAWWFVDDGHYSQRAPRAGTPVSIAGAIAPSDTFVIGWVVPPPPSNPAMPQSLFATPSEGSLFLMVRPAPL